MSAYVVEDTTINKVLAYLLAERDAGRLFLLRPLDEVGHALTQADTPTLGAARLGAAMRDLNIEAIRHRYADADTAGMIPSPFVFNPDGPLAARMHAYKALRCFLYQCAEGDCPQSPLWQALDHTSGIIAKDIVQNLPLYEDAPWG